MDRRARQTTVHEVTAEPDTTEATQPYTHALLRVRRASYLSGLLLFFSFFFLACTVQLSGSQFPGQESHLGPWQVKARGVPTNGPPGNSPVKLSCSMTFLLL